MYQIFCDDHLLYDPRLPDYAITDGTLTQKLNTSGTLTLVLPPGSRSVTLHKSQIRLTDRGEEIFRGRAISSVTDELGFVTLTCEGELGELNDHIVRPYDYSGDAVRQDEASAITYLSNLVGDYTAGGTGFTVDKTRCSQSLWKLGYSSRSSTLYPTVLDEIMDKLVSGQGGYLRISHVKDSQGQEVRYLDYVTAEDYGKAASQLPTIQLGTNLLDLEWTVSAEDLVTVLVPLGKRTDDAYLTVKDAQVNGAAYGKDYIENAQTIAQYGRIEGTNIWNDVTQSDNLYKKGVEYLEQVSALTVSLTATAADLSLAGYGVSSIRLGDQVRVKSSILGLDTVLTCTQRRYRLLDPAQDEITLESQVSASALSSPLTSKQITDAKASSAAYDMAETTAEEYAAIAKELGGYVSESTYTAGIAALSEEIEDIKAELTAAYRYRGTVQSVDLLPKPDDEDPTKRPAVGDVYNVEDTGANYAWDGTAWDKLSENIGDYVTREEYENLESRVAALEGGT